MKLKVFLIISLFLLVTLALFFLKQGVSSPSPSSSSSSLKLYSLANDNTLTPPKTLFKASEPVTFVLTFDKPTSFWPFSFIKKAFAQENPVSAQLTFNNEESKEVSLEIRPLEKDKFSFSLQPKIPGQLQPGKYQLKVNREENGQTQTLTQDFSWGVLALNPSKSIYLPGEVAKLGIGVLNDLGRTICNANVTLEITDPDGNKTTLNEANKFLRKSGQCQETSVTNVPDYLAGYKVGKAGVYKMHLEADNGNGVRGLDDNFEVRDSVPFDIERADFPMRIYPPAEYTGTITVTANQDFKGVVEETVPASFSVIPSATRNLPSSEDPSLIAQDDKSLNNQGLKTLTWNVNWKKGEKYELSYSIKFPQISPEFYLIGPLRLADARLGSSTPEVFREARQWQIASDAITTKWMESGTDATQGFQFWQSTGGTTDTAISSDTTVAKTGPRSIKVSSGTANGTSFAENRTGFSDTGTRVSAYFYFDDLPTSNISLLRITNSAYTDIATIRLNSTGTLSVLNTGVALGTGSTTLSADTWYRISIAYVITSTTDFDIKVFINGTPEIILSDSATLTNTSTNRMRIGWNAAPGAGEKVLHFDDIYIDNGTDATDPGDIRVTAKLPDTVNNNGFDTTTGTGAVNERPLSTTNRMTDTTSNTPGALQDYTLQTAATGDVDLSSSRVVTLVARTAWVWASRQSSCTGTDASIIDNGTETTITLTTSAAFYSVITDSGSYPSNAQGIGMRAIDGTCDTAFSEGGTLIAYKPVTNVQLQGIQMQGIQIK